MERLPRTHVRDTALPHHKPMLRRRLFLPIAAAVLLILGSGAPVAADTSVNVFGCFLNGGVEVVERGEVTVNSGWGAKSRGLVEAFLQAAIWTVTIDDAPVDVTAFLGPVTRREDGNWVVLWEYPAGTLADSGDELVVRVELDFEHAVFNGEELFQPGDVQQFDCTIVAE